MSVGKLELLLVVLVLYTEWRTMFDIPVEYINRISNISSKTKNSKLSELFDCNYTTPIKNHKAEVLLVDEAEQIFAGAYKIRKRRN